MIRHLRGSLSSNISEINKGGGCPPIKSPIRNHSVLRYFSRFKDDTIAGITGVVGDGGLNNEEGVSYYSPNTTPGVFFYEPWVQYFSGVSFRYKNLNLNDTIPHTPETDGTFIGGNNFLNICNRRELISGTDDDYINDQASNSIQNIELADEVVARDGSNYYNYNLYKKAHTMTITQVGQAPASKTGELMEFVYLHAFIPKCRAGELYIEIEDFDLTGATTNDYLIYCYYWESTTDQRTMASAFENVNDYLSGNANLLLTDQGNTCCKVFKLSDVKGTGTDNKIIIWLNRLKTKQEKFGVNVLIGLNPQELRRDETFWTDAGVPHPVISYSECDDIVFKFKRATIKTKKFATLINNQPLPFPGFGYKGLYENVYADNADFITIPIHALDASGNALPINTQSGIVGFGVPNGGATVSSTYTWFNDITFGASATSSYPHMWFADNLICQFSVYNFYRTTENIISGQNYILKLPTITDAIANKTITSSYVLQANNSDWVIRVYAGNELVSGVGGEYPHYQDMLDSFILLKTITVSTMTDGLLGWNSGSNYNLVGSPYSGGQERKKRKNHYEYVAFAGADLAALSNPIFFYMTIERTAHPITNISYGATGDGAAPPNTFYFPTGYGNPNTSNEFGTVNVIAEYLRAHYVSGTADLAKNYHAMLFKAPQIIAKTATPSAENYYSA